MVELDIRDTNDTSGKWIKEGDTIILLNKTFDKVAEFNMAFLNMRGD